MKPIFNAYFNIFLINVTSAQYIADLSFVRALNYNIARDICQYPVIYKRSWIQYIYLI